MYIATKSHSCKADDIHFVSEILQPEDSVGLIPLLFTFQQADQRMFSIVKSFKC